MKTQKIFRLVVFLGMSFLVFSYGQTRGMGLGGYLQAGNTGETGGLTGKLFLTPIHALELNVSIDPDLNGDMGAYVSYLFHFWDKVPVHTGKLPLYVGPNTGVGVWEDNGNNIAIRLGVIAGGSFCLPQGTVPMDFYLQLNPTLEHLIYEHGDNDSNIELFLQIGCRFFI